MLMEPDARLAVPVKSALVDSGPGHQPRKQLVPWQDIHPLASQACLLPGKATEVMSFPWWNLEQDEVLTF